MAKGEKQELGTTDTGIKPNIEALLAYLLGFVTGLIFLLIEKNNKFVRFHAMQSTLVFGGIILLYIVLALVPIIGWLILVVLSAILPLVSFILWLVLMWKAYNGERYKLPYFGNLAEKQLAKMK